MQLNNIILKMGYKNGISYMGFKNGIKNGIWENVIWKNGEKMGF